jgi:O-antigen/teichoic acid export membrane protein
LVEDGVFVRAARGAGALSIQSIASTLLGLVLFMVFARMVSKTEMGVYGAVTLVLSVVTIAGSLGLSYAASRFIPYYYGRGELGMIWTASKRILMASLLPTIAVFIALFLLSDVFSFWLLATTGYAYIFAIAAFAAFTSLLSLIASGFLRGLQRFGSLALFTFSSQVVRVGVSVGLLLLGFGVASIFIGWTVFGGILTILALVLTFKVLLRGKEKVNQGSDHFSFRVLFGFSLPMMVFDLVTYLSDSVDKFVVLGFLGSESLGVYTVVMTAAGSILMILVSPLLATMIPSMSETYGKIGVERVSEVFKVSSRYISLILIPACAGFAVLSPLVLQILAGSAYIGAALPLSIVSVGVCVYGFSVALLSSLTALGRTLRVATAILIASLIELAFCLLLVPWFGVIGAALSRAIMYGFMLGLLVFLGLKFMRISFDGGAVWRSIIASTVMVLLLFPLAHLTSYWLIMLPLYLVFGIIIYSIVLVLLRAIVFNDVKFFIKIIPKGENVFYEVESLARKSPTILRFLKWAVRN